MPITIGGQTYSDDQIREFYASGGNDNEFAQKAGITDPWQRREAVLNARQAAGGAGNAAYSGNAGLQNYFKQYQQYNPNGANANNFQGWLGDQNPHRRDAMQSGTYTGPSTSPTDSSPGGIYSGVDVSFDQVRNGLGARGWGEGWESGAPSVGGVGGGGNLGMGGGMGGNSGANYGGSSSSSSYTSGGQNPYLQDMGKTIVDQMTENYTRNQLPATRAGARAAGAVGSARQGVVEANGLQDLNRGIGQSLTNLYGQDWTNQQNRNLQNKSIDNSYDLGLRSNNLGFANLDSSNQQFGQTFGLNALNAQNNWAQQGVQNANAMQNTPIDYSRYFQGQANQTAGQGGTNTNTQTNPGNPYIGALGGAQLVNSWFKG